MAVVAKVWIDEDCITCDACQDICPEVFEVTDDSSMILAAVRTDGVFDRNVSGSPLVGGLGAELGDIIIEAAEACPVEVIKYELVSDGAVEEVVEAAPAAVEAAEPAAAVAPAAGVSDALNAVFAGDRSLNILFGSQTGNAAGLAEKTAKLAVDYGLQPNIVDMDGFDPARLATMKRVMIITSTWGEGEMPDNADGMWNAINANGPALGSVHFSVCAIGDTSYDEYCKAGHDWNNKLAALGGTEAYPIQECDVDFEPPWKLWVEQALPMLACVDESGTLQVELLDEMKAYGAGDDDDVIEGDFAPGVIEQEAITITVDVFRYAPEAAESGWDTLTCAVPGHATVQDLLITMQRDLDGSLAFRRGAGAGTPTTGVRVNGRIVLADAAQIGDLTKDGGKVRIEPLPGHPVVRDLVVDTGRYESHRSRAEPWMRTDPREGEHLPSGQAMGTMDSAAATALHQAGDVLSFQLIQAMSDTLPHDPHYEGPGVHFQQWLRAIDPRTSEKQRRSILASLQQKDGVWSEADHASLMRYGEDGRLAARALNEARGALLNQTKYAGKTGRLVKWYGRSVKWSGNVNETTLYRQVLGPLGLVSNVFSGVSARMALAFTRNGGPPIRSLQSLLLPPAGLGRIPKMFNSRVENYHEVVSLFNEIDQRF
ncbi:MAG: flavodoxin domain-containing protein [Candidatus Poseidonia sp.]|jgi:succinate dehydrogenase/fumarate reductase-like Fe-S protein/flavodoxin/ferredoxin|nr:flavodoxin domain-containing protein [Poseidonia sp.]